MPPTPPRRPLAARLGALWPLLLVPLAAVTVSLVAGWRYPVQIGDTAWLAQRVDDVFSSNPPLLGMPSTLGGGELDTHHPGPVQFYWLAPWWTLLEHRGIALGSAAASALALVWIGVTVRALPAARTATALGAQVVVAGGALTISPELLADPWNPFGALPWAMLLVVAAARVHAGDAGGWPALAVGATVATQLHAGYLPWVALLLVVLAIRAVRHPGSRPTGVPARVAAGAVALLWLPPLVDLVAGIRNPILIVRAALDPADTAESGLGGVLVAAAHALSPLHSTLDAVWIVPGFRWSEALTLLLCLVAAAATWWWAPRDHWARPLLGWAGGAALAWAAVASRAPLMDGLLAHSYVRPLWPLGALTWFAVLGVWWHRRPERLANAAWMPVVVLAVWALTIPTGYVGLDPAGRTRGVEVAEAVRRAPVPGGGLNVHAGVVSGAILLAPTVTATLDHRDVPSGVGTDPVWDHPEMSTRPAPLPGTPCRWQVGSPLGPSGDTTPPPDGTPDTRARTLLDERAPGDDEQRRKEQLADSLARRFPTLEPSRLAVHRTARTGTEALPDEPVDDLLRSGRFADLVVEGLLDRPTLRDRETAEYVELARLHSGTWADVAVTSRRCGDGGTA